MKLSARNKKRETANSAGILHNSFFANIGKCHFSGFPGSRHVKFEFPSQEDIREEMEAKEQTLLPKLQKHVKVPLLKDAKEHAEPLAYSEGSFLMLALAAALRWKQRKAQRNNPYLK